MQPFIDVGSEQCQNNKRKRLLSFPVKKKKSTKRQFAYLMFYFKTEKKTESTEKASHSYQAAILDNIYTVKRVQITILQSNLQLFTTVMF